MVYKNKLDSNLYDEFNLKKFPTHTTRINNH